MGISIQNLDEDKVTYSLVPEYVPESSIDSFKEAKKENEAINGYSKNRTQRLIGRVPWEMMYNYALSKGIPSDRVNEFFTEDNGKNMVALLNEFPVLKMVSQI